MAKNEKIQVFITRDIPSPGIDMLKEEGFDVSVWPHDRPIDTPSLIAGAGEANALITLSSDPVPADLLRACSHLDIISQFAVGYDNIDIDTASSLGIAVGNAPDAMTAATADIAFGLMIAVARGMFYMHKTIEKGDWTFFRPKADLGMELTGKTLGIFGLGRIGYAMAKRCRGAYDMPVLYCNRHPNTAAEKELGARRVSFEELLKRSDVLSVHSALTDETRGIFNGAAFEKMQTHAIFINTSRGGLVVEEDLIDTLRKEEIWGAGLDVTHPEPMDRSNPLLSMPHVAVLPHIGSATVEARNEMSRRAARNIIGFYKHGSVPFLVNPDYAK